MDGEAKVLPSLDEPEQGQFSDAESCTSYNTPTTSGFRPFFAQDQLPTVVVKPRFKKEEDSPKEVESRGSSSSELWDTDGPAYIPTMPGQFSDIESEEAPSDWIVDISAGGEAKTIPVSTRLNTRQRIATWTSKCPKLTAGQAAVVSAMTATALTSTMFALILSGISQNNSGCPMTNKINDLSGKAKVRHSFNRMSSQGS